jgi:sec-independent protein translocase protein TatC
VTAPDSTKKKRGTPWSWRRTPRTPDGTMTLIEHLYELRNRIMKAAVFVVIGMIVAWFLYNGILAILKHPYCALPSKYRLIPENNPNNKCPLVYTGPLDAFLIRLKVMLISGIVLSSPFWLYQLWAFITPGLKKNERRLTVTFVGASTVLFAGGACLAFFVLTKGLRVLVESGGSGTAALLSINQYLSFVIAMLTIFGASFEVPLLIVMLNMVGVLSYARLKKMQRILIFAIFAFSAIATPSQDPFTMLALAVPMCILFEAAVVICWRHDKRKAARGDNEFFRNLSDDETSPLDETPSPVEEPDPVDDNNNR